MSNTVFILDTSSSNGHGAEDDSIASLVANAAAGPSTNTKSSELAPPSSPPRFTATCGLCAGTLTGSAAALTCGHVFHPACIEAWYAVFPKCPRHAMCRLTGHLDRDAHTVYTGAASTTAPDPSGAHIRDFARYARALAKHTARQAAIRAMQSRIAKRRAAVQLARMRAHDRSLTVETERRRAMQPVRDEITAVRAQCDAVRKELARLDAEERAARDALDLDQRADAAASAVKLAFQAMTAAQREYDREVELARDRDLDLARAQQQRDRRRPTAPVIPPSSSPPPAAAAVWDLDEYMMRVVDPVDEEDEDEEDAGLPLRAATRAAGVGAPLRPARVLPPTPVPKVPAKPALRFGKVNLAPLVGRRGAGAVGKGAKAVKAKGQRTLDVYFKK